MVPSKVPTILAIKAETPSKPACTNTAAAAQATKTPTIA